MNYVCTPIKVKCFDCKWTGTDDQLIINRTIASVSEFQHYYKVLAGCPKCRSYNIREATSESKIITEFTTIT